MNYTAETYDNVNPAVFCGGGFCGERQLSWDEENRLRSICDNGYVSSYFYDAGGERTVKLHGSGEGIHVNSAFSGGYTNNVDYTLYVDAYMVLEKGGQYTKHIYIGDQRIVSKLGDVGSFGVDPRREQYAGEDVAGVEVPNYKTKYEALQNVIKDNYQLFEVDYYGVDNDNYVDGEGFCCEPQANTRKGRSLPTENVDYEKLQYYYHSDHLGSASYITNLDGEVVQHIEYVPFGEVFLEERNNTWNTPFLFNGKELDEETGLYYYGARYYNPRISLWYGVDPLAEKYPSVSAYAYCVNNPIMLVDPDGRKPDLSFGFRLGFKLGFGSNGPNFNVTASAGVEHRTPNFQTVAFASASVYGGEQLGTSSMTKGLQYDLTAGAYTSVGNGTGSPNNFYTLNFNTASPFDNTFDTSFTYGQARTFNSAINAGGDGPGWQTQGIVGLRIGENFSLSSNNDATSYGTGITNRLLGDNNTDAGWTGGIVLNIGGVEVGYQNFSGYWEEFPSLKFSDGFYTAENRIAGNGAYHQSLNRAFNFVKEGNVTGGVFSEAWFQNLIHKYFSDDGRYIYNNQGNVNTTIGQ